MDEEKDDIEKILGEIESKSKQNINEDSMEKISKVLNTTFEEDVASIEKQRKLIEHKKQLVAKKEAEGLVVLDDQEEIKNGLRATINNLEIVMEKLQGDIRIGSKAFSHEVYSKLASTLVESYKELAAINKTIFDCRFKLQQLLQKNTGKSSNTDQDKGDDSIVMTSSQLLAMVDEARKNSTMHSVDAQFKIIE